MDQTLDQIKMNSQEKTKYILDFCKSVNYEYLREENSQSAPWESIGQLRDKLMFLCKHQINIEVTDHMELMSESLVKYMELVVTFVHSGVNVQSQRKYLAKCLDIVPEVLPSNPPEFRNIFLELATEKILEIFVMDDLTTLCKGYLISTFNSCILGSDKKCRSSVGAKLIQLMFKLFDQLSNYGDYVIQSDILETIFRIYGNEIWKAKKPEQFISSSEKLSLALQQISLSDFDRDIRKWLNRFNRKSKKIFSLCATKLQLGDVTCQAPTESDGMWIDFNLQDCRMGWYCDVELNDNWAYVTFSTSNVVKADLTRVNNVMTLTITHNEPYICNITSYNRYFKELDKFVQIRFENIGTETSKRFRDSVLPIMFPTHFSRRSTSTTRFPPKKLYRPLSTISRRRSTSISVVSSRSTASSREVAAGVARLRSISGASTTAALSDAQDNISEIISIGDDSELGSENEKMMNSADSSHQSNQLAANSPVLSEKFHDSRTLMGQNSVPVQNISDIVSISEDADQTADKMVRSIHSEHNLSDVTSTGEVAEYEMRYNEKLQDNIVTSSIPPSEGQSSHYSDREETVHKPNSLILETSLEFRKSLLGRQAPSRQSSPVVVSRLLSSEVFELDDDSEVDQSVVKDTKINAPNNLSLEVAEIMKEFEPKKDKAVPEKKRQKTPGDKVILEETAEKPPKSTVQRREKKRQKNAADKLIEDTSEKQTKSSVQKADKITKRPDTPFTFVLSDEDEEDISNTCLNTRFVEERDIQVPVIVSVESLVQEKEKKQSKVAGDGQSKNEDKNNDNNNSNNFAKTECKSNHNLKYNESASLSKSNVIEMAEKSYENLPVCQLSSERTDQVDKSHKAVSEKSFSSTGERSDEDSIPLIRRIKCTNKPSKVLVLSDEDNIPLEKLKKIDKKSDKKKSKDKAIDDLSTEINIPLVQTKKSAKKCRKNPKLQGSKYKEPDSYQFGETEQILKLINKDDDDDNDDGQNQRKDSFNDLNICKEKGKIKKSKSKKKQTITRAQLKEINLSEKSKTNRPVVSEDDSITSSKFAICEALELKKIRKNKLKFKHKDAKASTSIAKTGKRSPFFKIKLANNKKLLKKDNQVHTSENICQIVELNTSEDDNIVNEHNETDYYEAAQEEVKNKPYYQRGETKDNENYSQLDHNLNASCVISTKNNAKTLSSAVISEDYQNTSTLFGFLPVDPSETVPEVVNPQNYTERQRWSEDNNANSDIHPSLQPQKETIKEPSDEILRSIEEGLLRQSQIAKEPPPQNHLVPESEERGISQTLASLDLAVNQQSKPEEENLNTPDLFDILDDRPKRSGNNTCHKESLDFFDDLKASTQKAITQFEQQEINKKGQTQVLKVTLESMEIIPQATLKEQSPYTHRNEHSLKETQETIHFNVDNKHRDEINATSEVVKGNLTQDSDIVQGPTTKKHLERLQSQDFDVENQHPDNVQNAELELIHVKRTQDSDIVQGPTVKRHLERLETKDLDLEDEQLDMVEVKVDKVKKNLLKEKKKRTRKLLLPDDSISELDSQESIQYQKRRVLRTKRKKKTKTVEISEKIDFGHATEEKSEKTINRKAELPSKSDSSESDSVFKGIKQQEKDKLLENNNKSIISKTNKQLQSAEGILELNNADKVRMQEEPSNIDNNQKKCWLLNAELENSDSTAPEEREPVLVVSVADVHHKDNVSSSLNEKGPNEENKVTSTTVAKAAIVPSYKPDVDDILSNFGDQTRTTLNTTARSKRLYNPEKDNMLLLERLAENVDLSQESISPMPMPATSTPIPEIAQPKAKRGRKKNEGVAKAKEKCSKTRNTSTKRPKKQRKSSKPIVDFGYFEGFSSHKELSLYQAQKKDSSHFLRTIVEERSRRTTDFIARNQQSSSPNQSSSNPYENIFAQKTPEDEAIPSSDLEMEPWSSPGFKYHKTSTPIKKSPENIKATPTRQPGEKTGNNKIKILENILVSKKFEDRTIIEEPPRKKSRLSQEAEEEPFDVPVPVDNLNEKEEFNNEKARAIRHDQICYQLFILNSELLRFRMDPQSKECSELRNRAYSCCRELLKEDI